MAAVPRIGPPRAGTVVAADLGPSLAAYRDHLDLQVISDAPLAAALAAAWGKPALAGCGCVLMGADPADPSTHWLRLLEVPGAVAPAPMRQRGWLALEVLVRDVQALGRRLEGGPFRVLGTPRPLSVSDDIWAMQVAGPAGETLYLTEVRAQVPPFELPMNARHTAERLFIPVLSAPDREAAHTRLRDYFAAVPAPDKVTRLEDLAPVIELYHHTVRAGQLDEGRTLFHDRIQKTLLYQLGAYLLIIDLLRPLFPDGEDRPPRLKDEMAQAWTLNELANAYGLSGQPREDHGALVIDEAESLIVSAGIGDHV